MASPLDGTMGIWLVSLFLATILYGMGILQTYLYFHWYGKDHWGIKAVIIALVIFETLHVAFFFYGTYNVLIDHFGEFEKINDITWFDSAHLLAGFISAFLVQMYFAYCIYILSPKYMLMPILIVVLALVQLGSGMAQAITTQRLGHFSLLDKTKATTTIQAVSTLICDVAITACLCFTLGSKRAGLKSTKSLVNKLMINAVNRGMLTSFAAALNLILFFAIPHTFWFFLGLIPSAQLYMNSMLATLNVRQHIRNGAIEDGNAWNSNSIPISSIRPTESQAVAGNQVAVGDFSQFDSPYDGRKLDDGRKITFP